MTKSKECTLDDHASQVMNCMGRVAELHKAESVGTKGGKTYTEVKHRVTAFRETFGYTYGIDTNIISELCNDKQVAVKCTITEVSTGNVVGSGLAFELIGKGLVNQTSALENCDTSAIGRALASIGLGGSEYASSFEMGNIGNKAGKQFQEEFPGGFDEYKKKLCNSDDKEFKEMIDKGKLTLLKEVFDADQLSKIKIIINERLETMNG